MTAADPAARPSAEAVADRLGRIAVPPGMVVPTPLATPDSGRTPGSDVPLGVVRGPGPSGLSSGTGANVTPVEELSAQESSGGWVAVPYQGEATATPYTPTPYGDWLADAPSGFPDVLDGAPPPRRQPEAKRSRIWVWLAVGAGLQFLAILGWIYLVVIRDGSGGD